MIYSNKFKSKFKLSCLIINITKIKCLLELHEPFNLQTTIINTNKKQINFIIEFLKLNKHNI